VKSVFFKWSIGPWIRPLRSTWFYLFAFIIAGSWLDARGAAYQSPDGKLSAESDSNPLTIESFWQRRPIIEKMLYWKISPDGKQQEFLFRIDGTNALICPVDSSGRVNGFCTGRFQSIFWHYYPDMHILETVDSRINKIEPVPQLKPGQTFDSSAGPVGQAERNIFQRNADSIATLGLPEIDRNAKMEWDPNNQQLLASASGDRSERNRGLPVVLTFQPDSRLPAGSTLRAIIKGKPGKMGIFESYKYSSNFFAGRFPNEIIRFAPSESPGAASDSPEYSIRIKELVLSAHPIPDSDMNPLKIFGTIDNLHLMIWSNNIEYEMAGSHLRKFAYLCFCDLCG
jgi:hypothetical protein